MASHCYSVQRGTRQGEGLYSRSLSRFLNVTRFRFQDAVTKVDLCVHIYFFWWNALGSGDVVVFSAP